ncbi:MAG TPA: DUF2815 family protein [Chitinophagaceae bacterium]|nr:DUF2815 family protein [Chitinophagaceae bacterium]
MSTEKNVETKVVTSKVRFSYVHVWEPTAMNEGQDKSYSVSLIIPKSDKALIAKINAAVEAAIENGKSKWGGKVPTKNFKRPLRDGDLDRPEDDAYANSYFLTAKCSTKPGVVDRYKKEITKQEEFYSGCYGLASVNFFAYATKGNNGIGCGLNNLMKIEDGDALGGRVSASIDFAEVEVSEEEDDLL